MLSDRNRSIIAVTLGVSGLASDATVQQQAHWARFPGSLFSLGERLVGDKGMQYTDRVVGPCIGQRGQSAIKKRTLTGNFLAIVSRLSTRFVS